MKFGKTNLAAHSQTPFRMRNVVVVVSLAVSGLAVGNHSS
jgi:hypothetical protein